MAARLVDLWINTATGLKFDLPVPKPEQFHLQDFALGLSRDRRYGGQTSFESGIEGYAVAQHLVLCSYLVEAKYAFDALMHDMAEGYTKDISSPIKRFLPDYKVLENGIQEVGAARFNFRWPKPGCVDEVDLRIMATEARDLMIRASEMWMLDKAGITPYPWHITPWSTMQCYLSFIQRFIELKPDYDARDVKKADSAATVALGRYLHRQEGAQDWLMTVMRNQRRDPAHGKEPVTTKLVVVLRDAPERDVAGEWDAIPRTWAGWPVELRMASDEAIARAAELQTQRG